MDSTIASAAAAVIASGSTADQVNVLYRSGDPRQREIALATMARDPSLLNVDAVLNSISHSATGNEQYQALSAALNGVEQFTGDSATALRDAVQAAAAPAGFIVPGTARFGVAQALLQKLPPQQ